MELNASNSLSNCLTSTRNFLNSTGKSPSKKTSIKIGRIYIGYRFFFAEFDKVYL